MIRAALPLVAPHAHASGVPEASVRLSAGAGVLASVARDRAGCCIPGSLESVEDEAELVGSVAGGVAGIAVVADVIGHPNVAVYTPHSKGGRPTQAIRW